MSSSNLIRLGGLAAVLSGALLVIAELMYLVVGTELSAESLSSASSLLQSVLFLIAWVLSAGALAGFYAARSESLGPLGAAGFLVAFVGTVLVAGSSWGQVFIAPTLAREAPGLLEAGLPVLLIVGIVLSFLPFSLGWLMFGVAAFRGHAYPRVASVLLAVGAVLAFVSAPLTSVVFAVAIAWMGLNLLSGRGASTEQTSRVR